jgi:hypothetical protein
LDTTEVTTSVNPSRTLDTVGRSTSDWTATALASSRLFMRSIVHDATAKVREPANFSQYFALSTVSVRPRGGGVARAGGGLARRVQQSFRPENAVDAWATTPATMRMLGTRVPDQSSTESGIHARSWPPMPTITWNGPRWAIARRQIARRLVRGAPHGASPSRGRRMPSCTKDATRFPGSSQMVPVLVKRPSPVVSGVAESRIQSLSIRR